MKKIAMYGINFEIINGAYPAFADCRIGTTVSPLILWYCNHNLGLGLSAYDQIDTRELRPSVFTAMLLSQNTALQTSSHAESTAKTAGNQPVRMFFDKAGVLICRPENPTAHSMGVALKGGNNAEHHNHNDVGSYSHFHTPTSFPLFTGYIPAFFFSVISISAIFRLLLSTL